MITAASSTQLITDGLRDFSTQALVILGSVIVIAVGLLVFYWGWKHLMWTTDGSGHIAWRRKNGSMRMLK